MSYTPKLNAVFGARDANSYVTVEEASASLAVRDGGGAWQAMERDRPADEALKRREQLLATASRLVDTPTYRYARFFSYERGFAHVQALKFPWAAHPYLYARAAGGTKGTLVVEALARPDLYPDGFFVGGAVHVRRGKNRHAARAVSGFDGATGTLSVSPDFEETPDQATEFYVLWAPDSALKDAVIEQAYHLLLANPHGEAGELDDAAELSADGIASASVAGVPIQLDVAPGDRRAGVPALCNVARLLLRPYLARSADAGRA